MALSWKSLRLKSLPWLTLAMGLGAVLLARLPAAGSLLGYDRAAVASGELWRLVTCHFVHVNGSHLFWDLFALLSLGLLFEKRIGKAYTLGMLASIVVIPVAVAFFQPSLRYYWGLSGLDSAAYTLCGFHILKDAIREKRLWGALVPLAAFGALIFKIIYELSTGLTLFADPAGSALAPVPLAHIVGGAIGALALWPALSNRVFPIPKRRETHEA